LPRRVFPLERVLRLGEGELLDLGEEEREDGKYSFFLVVLLPRWDRFGDGELLELDEVELLRDRLRVGKYERLRGLFLVLVEGVDRSR
jgi:hypothetical protein